ncbi:potassium-transporting ATPase potassium-binding subunit [Glutamicibacter uratoxydans]|uniref:Potassium-transporting ATPase potassium-binding subunit n=1 Tax=Glutamicibacter uratoxydans TaxID=43667 RepID=A0A4Y4DRD6_GLUUR|nr:potassium-transporting ATPase subunit KdpA [Glutamicibacter uratoxydans]GED05928.1 potassium-transporting ATPase potassium-binding subunit [Glutamicibacter uratoxydans]
MPWLNAAGNLLLVAAAIAVLYRPLGDYMAWVYTASGHLRTERWIYRLISAKPEQQHSWRGYLGAVFSFSLAGFILLYAVLAFDGMGPDLAFNTAVSFVANTNWQSYVPEQSISYVAQMAGLSVQNFVSAAVSMCVAVALIRAIAAHRAAALGNFWVDLVRTNLRILLPLSIVFAVLLLACGVVQNFTESTALLPGGPVASQESIKMLGTNGGGFYNANSAHPFENPTPISNLMQVLMLLLIPFTLLRTFGTMVSDQRAGYALLLTMSVLFLLVYLPLTYFELHGSGTAPQLAGAAMEGKEQRFGIIGSTLFATATTGTTGGAVNSMHGSYTALGGLMLMVDMVLGEVAPGGAGSGLYAVLVLVVIAVFVTALLLGRTPVYLGKQLGTRELKLVSIAILIMPVLSLGGMALASALPYTRAEIIAGMGNPGSHGFSEVLYAFISAAINNGSAFAGFSANTPGLNTLLGLIILAGRFAPISIVLALAGALATAERASSRSAELPLHRPQFVGFLVSLIMFIAVPTFIPLFLVGPLAEGLMP